MTTEQDRNNQKSGTLSERTTARLERRLSDRDFAGDVSLAGFHNAIDDMLPLKFKNVSIDGVHERIRGKIEIAIDRILAGDSTGLILLGDVGNGKTAILRILWSAALAGVIGAYLQTHEFELATESSMYGAVKSFAVHSVKYMKMADLIKRIRTDFLKSGRAKTDERSSDDPFMVRYLFIDDLGRGYEDKEGLNLSQLEELFDHRWENGLPTYISTNKTADELRELAGWGRIVDRIADKRWIVPVNVPSGSLRRTPANMQTATKRLNPAAHSQKGAQA